jgi:hypothetical protein
MAARHHPNCVISASIPRAFRVQDNFLRGKPPRFHEGRDTRGRGGCLTPTPIYSVVSRHHPNCVISASIPCAFRVQDRFLRGKPPWFHEGRDTRGRGGCLTPTPIYSMAPRHHPNCVISASIPRVVSRSGQLPSRETPVVS